MKEACNVILDFYEETKPLSAFVRVAKGFTLSGKIKRLK
jgi:hypothetical protein